MLFDFVCKVLLGIYGGDNWHFTEPYSMDTLICTYFDLVVYDVNKSVLCFMEWLILSRS